MATVNLLNNLPIENLTPDNDYLGIIDKGDLIANFLKGNKNQFSDIKMFTLYGEWGSGKSTLMKYIQKEVEADFNTYFFEAWQYEKNENLAMSLLEYIDTNSAEEGEPFYKDVLKYGGRILRGLAKSVKINAPLYPNGPALEFDATGLVDELSQQEKLTFYQILEKFKKEFVIMEDRINAQTQKDWNVVFIDDLDRCEPEQVLNLLSAIKLFFTYGKRTIFFCGIDKKAVEEAVKTKYVEIVKANEYLEKIFDVSFTMPNDILLIKLIRNYFDKSPFYRGTQPIYQIVTHFFSDLNFKNPRRVKKVLNKFELVRMFKKSSSEDVIFPNIDENEGNGGSLFETLIVIYLIILHEFYPRLFNDFLDLENKIHRFEKISGDFRLPNISSISIETQELKSMHGNDGIFNDNKFAFTICPSEFENVIKTTPSDSMVHWRFYSAQTDIESNFFVFILKNITLMTSDLEMSGSTFKSIKRLMSNIL